MQAQPQPQPQPHRAQSDDDGCSAFAFACTLMVGFGRARRDTAGVRSQESGQQVQVTGSRRRVAVRQAVARWHAWAMVVADTITG